MSKLRIELEKLIPFSFYEVLSQYYDYEHIEHVHPTSLGRYEMHEETDTYVAYRQIWPNNAESIVRHYHEPPNKMRFEFIGGKHKGTIVHTTLHAAEGGTLVHEAYEMNLPNWSWFKRLVKPFVRRSVDHIWDEDLAVEVCHDGWPGIPKAMLSADKQRSTPVISEDSAQLPVADLAEGAPIIVTVNNTDVAVFKIGKHYHAIDNRCPHTGGPLHLGEVRDTCVACPWHGRRFNLETGAPESPDDQPLRTFAVEQHADILRITRP